jgi:hypothetical protein
MNKFWKDMTISEFWDRCRDLGWKVDPVSILLVFSHPRRGENEKFFLMKMAYAYRFYNYLIESTPDDAPQNIRTVVDVARNAIISDVHFDRN